MSDDFFAMLTGLSETAPPAVRILVQMFDSPWSALMSPPPGQRGARGSGTRSFAGRPLHGAFSTKIHLKTDYDGLMNAFELTGGEAADSPMFETLLDTGSDAMPRAIVADKGYDSDVNRALACQRGTVPVIPYRKNRKTIPERFAKALYKVRARIEQAVGKLKRFKRVALRCEKTARNFRAFVALAAAFILTKSVHTT